MYLRLPKVTCRNNLVHVPRLMNRAGFFNRFKMPSIKIRMPTTSGIAWPGRDKSFSGLKPFHWIIFSHEIMANTHMNRPAMHWEYLKDFSAAFCSFDQGISASVSPAYQALVALLIRIVDVSAVRKLIASKTQPTTSINVRNQPSMRTRTKIQATLGVPKTGRRCSSDAKSQIMLLKSHKIETHMAAIPMPSPATSSNLQRAAPPGKTNVPIIDKMSQASHALKDLLCARMVQERSTARVVVAAANLKFGFSALTRDISMPMVCMYMPMRIPLP